MIWPWWPSHHTSVDGRHAYGLKASSLDLREHRRESITWAKHSFAYSCIKTQAAFRTPAVPPSFPPTAKLRADPLSPPGPALLHFPIMEHVSIMLGIQKTKKCLLLKELCDRGVQHPHRQEVIRYAVNRGGKDEEGNKAKHGPDQVQQRIRSQALEEGPSIVPLKFCPRRETRDNEAFPARKVRPETRDGIRKSDIIRQSMGKLNSKQPHSPKQRQTKAIS